MAHSGVRNATQSGSSRPPVALQLYTVRDLTARDFAGTVRRVGAIGYDGVEFAGYGGMSAADMAALLADAGLRAASTHVGFARVETHLDAEIEYCLGIGCSFLVLAGLPDHLHGPEHLPTLVPLLENAGRRCRDRGITFGYHNHDWELARGNGRTILETMLAETHPEQVCFELDVYWAAFAGVDPRRFLESHAGRIPLVHLKDMAQDRSWTEVGDGTLDLPGLYEDAGRWSVRWCVVEHDRPTLPSLESARRSLENLRPRAATRAPRGSG